MGVVLVPVIGHGNVPACLHLFGFKVVKCREEWDQRQFAFHLDGWATACFLPLITRESKPWHSSSPWRQANSIYGTPIHYHEKHIYFRKIYASSFVAYTKLLASKVPWLLYQSHLEQCIGGTSLALRNTSTMSMGTWTTSLRVETTASLGSNVSPVARSRIHGNDTKSRSL
jgi:hypothetical protein